MTKPIVYFSGSIQGILNQEPDFAWKLIQYMTKNGAQILDPHVAGRNEKEKLRLFIKTRGFNPHEVNSPWCQVETIDITQVDRATHIVAVVNGPSHGVGNEIQRAIDNYEFRKKTTKILCLVREDLLSGLSWMIRGKQKPQYPNFHLQTYENFEEAKHIVTRFLTQR